MTGKMPVAYWRTEARVALLRLILTIESWADTVS